MFGIGNILLKIKRKDLPRPEYSSWISLLVAIIAVIIAIIGNATLNPAYLGVFFEYFIPTFLVVMIMLNRISILRILLTIIKYIFEPIRGLVTNTNTSILKSIDRINSQEFVYYTKDDNVETLNKVMLYIKKNENTRKLKVVAVCAKGENLSPQFMSDIDVLDREYPAIKIEFIRLEGVFGPDLIYKLSRKWKIPVNFMFIASPGNHFPYKI